MSAHDAHKDVIDREVRTGATRGSHLLCHRPVTTMESRGCDWETTTDLCHRPSSSRQLVHVGLRHHPRSTFRRPLAWSSAEQSPSAFAIALTVNLGLKSKFMVSFLLVALVLSPSAITHRTTVTAAVAAAATPTLTRSGRKELNRKEALMFQKLQQAGYDNVGHTEEAAAMRNYQLRKKKRKGLLRKRQADLMEILFPGVTPELYEPGESVFMFTDLVQSKKTHVPFEFYDLPGCPAPALTTLARRSNHHKIQRKNLGARLQGVENKPAPFVTTVLQNVSCTALCAPVAIGPKKVRWLRKLVERQYRTHLTFDGLPVLMRSSKYNFAVRGYPIGFVAPPSYTGLSHDEFYLYNHLKYTITYINHGAEAGSPSDESSATTSSDTAPATQGGIYITGFDVSPVSVDHSNAHIQCLGDQVSPSFITNNQATYMPLRIGKDNKSLMVTYSYEIEWVASNLPWGDRWDIYLLGSPDDDVHAFAIINSLMIVLFLTGAVATIMIRTLRQDISAYNNDIPLEDGVSEETGWKLVHGDVFRPPSTSPLALSIAVGTGAQIGTAFGITLLAAVFKLLNPIKKGHTLTAVLIVYVLTGTVSGYISARIYKFCDAKDWKLNSFLTATALPSLLVGIFTILNVFLSFAGAATAVSFLTLLAIFSLWICVSAPLVFLGSFFGFRAPKFDVPTKTNKIARVVPTMPWFALPPASNLLGGILPFGSVCIELFFIMSALWLHQIYYVMGFLLAVLLILAATCAQVAVVMNYLQLCAEDHRWWWKSFANCASAGFYLFLYSLWFLMSRLDLVGFLPVVVYLTYMSMISLCFGLFCGSVGFLCALAFNRTIYGELKVD